MLWQLKDFLIIMTFAVLVLQDGDAEMTAYSRQDLMHLWEQARQEAPKHPYTKIIMIIVVYSKRDSLSINSYRYSYASKNNATLAKVFQSLLIIGACEDIPALVQEVFQSFWEKITIAVIVLFAFISTIVLRSQTFYLRALSRDAPILPA